MQNTKGFIKYIRLYKNTFDTGEKNITTHDER